MKELCRSIIIKTNKDIVPLHVIYVPREVVKISNLTEYLERLTFKIYGPLKLNCINFPLIAIAIILKIKHAFVHLFNIKTFLSMTLGQVKQIEFS